MTWSEWEMVVVAALLWVVFIYVMATLESHRGRLKALEDRLKWHHDLE